MAYSFYLNGVLLPVAPEAVQTKINGKNETMVLMDQGEVNILKTPGLTEISFDALLPNSRYPFAVYPGGFCRADYYLSMLEQLKVRTAPFRLVISRETADGAWLYGTSMAVSLEDYTMKEDAGKYGTDVLVSLKFKQYRDYGTKTCRISGNTALISSSRETAGAPAQTLYQVQEGESWWEVAAKCYGDGGRYPEIQEANGFSGPDGPPAGQTIFIPR